MREIKFNWRRKRMREIKFRGKRTDNGEWVVGCLIIISHKAWIKDINDKTTNQRRLAKDFADFSCVEVEKETVGQYTGLKDKNGKEIYEGDIVINGTTIIYGGGNKQTFKDVGVVRWDVKNCCIVLNNKKSTKRLTHKTMKQYGIKVIGNIYDNPELLEVQE